MAEIKTTQTEKITYKPKCSDKRLPKSDKQTWSVYLLQTKAGTLYTGVTNDLIKRMNAHEKGKGSKYVKAKGFKKLINFKKCKTKSEACKAEHQIKQLSKTEKLAWFHKNS